MKVVRLWALRTDRLYLPQISLVLISGRGWDDPRAGVRADEKIPITPSGIQPATFRLVARVLYSWQGHVTTNTRIAHCWVSFATMVTRMCHSVTLYVHCLPRYVGSYFISKLQVCVRLSHLRFHVFIVRVSEVRAPLRKPTGITRGHHFVLHFTT